MSRRVMVDVGGHLGETLAEAQHRRWAFDRIFVFEPAPPCLPALLALADERVEIIGAGWWNADVEMELHDPGHVGASVVRAKALTEAVQRCRFVDAAAWMRSTLEAEDIVWLKMNCEGSECTVLDHLVAEGEVTRIAHLVVHFDVEKIPALAWQATGTRQRLAASGVEWIEADEILFGRSHAQKTANWLAWTEASTFGRFRYRHLARWEFRGRQTLYPLKQRLGGARPRHDDVDGLRG